MILKYLTYCYMNLLLLFMELEFVLIGTFFAENFLVFYQLD